MFVILEFTGLIDMYTVVQNWVWDFRILLLSLMRADEHNSIQQQAHIFSSLFRVWFLMPWWSTNTLTWWRKKKHLLYVLIHPHKSAHPVLKVQCLRYHDSWSSLSICSLQWIASFFRVDQHVPLNDSIIIIFVFFRPLLSMGIFCWKFRIHQARCFFSKWLATEILKNKYYHYEDELWYSWIFPCWFAFVRFHFSLN